MGFGNLVYVDWDNRIPAPKQNQYNFEIEFQPMAEYTNVEKKKSHRRLRVLNLILSLLILLGLFSLAALILLL